MVDDTETSQELRKQMGSEKCLIELRHADSDKLTAIAMAVSVSVTVSMGEDKKGVLRVTLRVILLSSDT